MTIPVAHIFGAGTEVSKEIAGLLRGTGSVMLQFRQIHGSPRDASPPVEDVFVNWPTNQSLHYSTDQALQPPGGARDAPWLGTEGCGGD